jgi:hypothetical protein
MHTFASGHGPCEIVRRGGSARLFLIEDPLPARYGGEPEVFFEHVAVPGREAAIDFTNATELGVTIASAWTAGRPASTRGLFRFHDGQGENGRR